MINKIIIDALSSIAPVYPDFTNATEEEYIVFAFRLSGALFGDNNPELNEYNMTIDYIAPSKKNVIAKREAIIKVLNELGTYPTEVNATTAEYQHYYYNNTILAKAIL